MMLVWRSYTLQAVFFVGYLYTAQFCYVCEQEWNLEGPVLLSRICKVA